MLQKNSPLPIIMIKTAYKNCIALLMLLAFASQVITTSAMTCKLENVFTPASVTSMHDSAHENHMDHSTHAMNHPCDASQNKIIEHEKVSVSQPSHHQPFCCKTMAHCLLGCALISLNNNFLFQFDAISSGVEDFYSSTSSDPFIPSRYRPPIFA